MNLEQAKQSGKHKARKRLGRGNASGQGKTSGRGHKGAKSRSGYSRGAHFEGGNLPMYRRVRKKGFSNAPFKKHFTVVNVGVLETLDAGSDVDLDLLLSKGLVAKGRGPLKVLGDGTLTRKLTVTAEAFTAQARAKIDAAGGKTLCTAPVQKTKTQVAKDAASARAASAPASAEEEE